MIKTIKARILLVEDDTNLGIILSDFLEMNSFSVTLATDGISGLENFRKGNFDLCILDVMLPYKDGFSLADDIRKADSNIPLIFLTAKNMEKDKIKGLKTGADDYLTKPFSTEELKLRISAILRRTKYPLLNSNIPAVFNIGRFVFDYSSLTLSSSDWEKRLTKKESEVLRLLSLNMNQIVKREVVLNNIWGDDDYFKGRSMDVYITKLRKILSSDNRVSIINIPRTGFKLEVKQ